MQRECLEHVGPKHDMERNDHRIIQGPSQPDAAPNHRLKLRGKIDIWFRHVSGRDVVRRICIGTLVAAPFLLVPMIILQFYTSTAWKLCTISIAVVLFSVFLAIFADQSDGEHLTAVSAYAAVMVVFIGTTTTC